MSETVPAVCHCKMGGQRAYGDERRCREHNGRVQEGSQLTGQQQEQQRPHRALHVIRAPLGLSMKHHVKAVSVMPWAIRSSVSMTMGAVGGVGDSARLTLARSTISEFILSCLTMPAVGELALSFDQRCRKEDGRRVGETVARVERPNERHVEAEGHSDSTAAPERHTLCMTQAAASGLARSGRMSLYNNMNKGLLTDTDDWRARTDGRPSTALVSLHGQTQPAAGERQRRESQSVSASCRKESREEEE